MITTFQGGVMPRRRWKMFGIVATAAMVTVLVTVLVTPGAAGAATSNVAGTMSGPGGFRIGQICNGSVTEIGTGTYAATGLGQGQYSFDVCITTAPVLSFAGTVTFTTSNGATLDGTISGTFTGGIGPTFNVTVTGGTKRFRHARGDLVIGPLVESSFSNCQRICLAWTDTGPVSGTLRHVSRR